jgi:hypothetical protein
MVLLCGTSYILRVYVHIRNYIWFGIAFPIFVYDTLVGVDLQWTWSKGPSLPPHALIRGSFLH